jgi:hypothetical protein
MPIIDLIQAKVTSGQAAAAASVRRVIMIIDGFAIICLHQVELNGELEWFIAKRSSKPFESHGQPNKLLQNLSPSTQ